MKADIDWLTPELIRAMIRESEEHESRQKFLETSLLCWKYYNTNRFWISPDGMVIADPALDSEIPISYENRIKQIVDNGVSILLKNNPIVRHYPQPDRPQDADIADDMDRRLYALWDEGGAAIKKVLKTLLLEAEVSGMSIAKVVWNPSNKLKDDDGDVMVYKLINKDVFLDPYATNDHRARDCRYIIHRTYQLPEAIIARYGKDGEVALGLRSKRGRDKESPTSKLRKVWSQFANTAKERDRNNQTESDNRIEVYEVWINNVNDESNLLIGGEEIDERDFPYGLVATMINDEIVDIRPNPNAEKRTIKELETLNTIQMYSNKRVVVGSRTHPFVVWYWNPTADNDGFNGIYNCTGIVEALIPLQISYNSLSTNIEINARTLANPSISIIDGAIRDLPPDRITALPGAIYRVHPDFSSNIDGAIRFNVGVPMPNFVDAMRMDKRMSMQELSGIHPAMIGLEPQGTSHLPMGTLAGLQEAAYGPLTGPIKELESALYDISVLAEGLMQQHYKVGRFFEITNDGMQRYIEWQTRHITANLIRKVVAGSTTPIADIEKEQRLANITSIVEAALQSNNPMSIKNIILYLQNINNPYAYDWIQLLQTALSQLQVQQELMVNQMVGESVLNAQAQGQQQMPQEVQASAQAQNLPEQDIEEVARELGYDPAQLRAALSAS